MSKFSLKSFVMRTLESMKSGGEDEYRIMQYALKYYEKGVLTEENLEEIEKWYEQQESVETVQPSEIDESAKWW